MAVIAETRASLRFYGDDLDPDDLTARLGGRPTSWASKGDVTASGHIVRTGRWILQAEPLTPGNLDRQITQIMAGLTDNDLVWRALAKYHPDLFCGLYLQESNEGIGINEENLSLLAQRGISLSLDVYCRRRLKLVR